MSEVSEDVKQLIREEREKVYCEYASRYSEKICRKIYEKWNFINQQRQSLREVSDTYKDLRSHEHFPNLMCTVWRVLPSGPSLGPISRSDIQEKKQELKIRL